MVSVLGDYTYKFPEQIPLVLRLKNMLQNNVDEKYYLTRKQLNYAIDLNNSQAGTKWAGRANSSKLNLQVASTIGVRSAGGNQRVGVSNFVIDNIDEEISVKQYKAMMKEPLAYDEQNGYIRKCGTVGTLTTDGSSPKHNNRVIEGARIRKLTPLECWRLMGFDDEDFHKAEKLNSNAQLYKQAGNSIVVDVLYYIFREMF
jgi:DNA (cytosine-5)-methyltransferase 1